MARTDSKWKTGIGGTYIQTIAPLGYDILINGTDKYLNFNTDVGASGYGFRDNNGVMEFKNSGGSWSTFGGGVAAAIEIGVTDVDGGTPGSVLFVAADGTLGQDNANFFWDDTNNRFGLGIAVPLAGFHNNFNGAASISAGLFSGTPFIGTGTTSTPLLLMQETATSAATTWNSTASTGGTYWGINARSGFTGNLIDTKVNNNNLFSVSGTGLATFNSFVSGSSQGSFTISHGNFRTYLQTSANNINQIVGSTYHVHATAGIYIGSAENQPLSRLHVGSAPTASANVGLISLASGAFDGSTAGFFTGSSNGTLIAGNLASGYTGDYIHIGLNVAGTFQTKMRQISDGRFSINIDSTTTSNARSLTINTASGTTGNLGFYQNGSEVNTLQSTSTFFALDAGGQTRWNIAVSTGNIAMGNTNVLETTARLGVYGASLTGSANTRILNLNQTWNTSGVIDGAFRMAITDTASGANSLLMALYGGASATTLLFSVDKSGTVATGSSINSGGSVRATSSGALGWTSRSELRSLADGSIRLANAAGTDFSLLQFGGTTSSFPSLKRNGTGFDVRLADDSGYGGLRAGFLSGTTVYLNGFTSCIKSPSSGVILLQDSAETDFARLQFGGTTSSFPSIKKSSADIHFRLADDSAYANIRALDVNAATYSNSATGIVDINSSLYVNVANGLTSFLGTTSSFPALKRSGATLEVKLADDSAYAVLKVASLQTVNGVVKRVITTTDDATAVIDVTLTDVYELSAVANNTTFSTTGTPVDSQEIWIRWKDAGVSKTLTWDAIFVAIGVTLPTATTASKWGYAKCMYNSAASKFHVLAVGVEA